jgi:S1-C subfamily serine protease
MRRFLLAGLFIVALFSMLCIGFVLGAVFSPALGGLNQAFRLGLNRGRIEQFQSNGPDSRLPRNPGQLPAVPPGFSFGPDMPHPGALIREVVPGSPAESAGLKVGQLIQAVDAVQLDGTKNLADLIAAHKPGDTLTLTIFDPSANNTSQTLDVKVKLGQNPDKSGAAWLGIRFASIDINNPHKKSPGG